MADEYLKLEQYPSAIREVGEALLKVRHQHSSVEAELKNRKVFLNLHGGVTGSNEKARTDNLSELCQADEIYRGLTMRECELAMTKDRLDVDHRYLRDQFAVMQLQLRERITFAIPLASEVADVDDEPAPF